MHVNYFPQLITKTQPFSSSIWENERSPEIEEETIVETESQLAPRWKIIAHDDNVTTMDFVIKVMVVVFKKPLIFAEGIMWQVHNEGSSVIDVLPKPEAERLVRQATFMARMEGFPFRLTIEPEE